MLLKRHHALQILLLSAALTLSACGGGGSSSATTNNTSTPSGSNDTSSTDGTSGGTSGGTSSGTTSGGTSGGTTPSGGGGTPAPTSTAVECPIGDYKSAVVATINSIRSSLQVCGGVSYPAVGSLSWNAQLEYAAELHSNDMAVNNFWYEPFPHIGTDGTTLRDRVPASGYRYSAAGENVAAGHGSVSDVFFMGDGKSWMSSAGHCVAIMTAVYVDVGVSCKYNPNSDYKYYWTLVMGKSF